MKRGIKKKNAVFGRYPCCDMINNAIRFILQGETDVAIDELFVAILKADGYIHDDLEQEVYKAHNRVVDARRR